MKIKPKSFEEFIHVLEPHIPEELISAQSLKEMRKVAKDLPLLSFGVFECWLDDTHKRVDLNVCISGILNENKLVEEWLSASTKTFIPGFNEKHKKIGGFLSKWSAPDFYLAPFINHFWLIYDLPQGADEISPWYYISFFENELSRDIKLKAEIILQVFIALQEPIVKEFENTWRPFIEHISRNALLNTVGVQTSRATDSLRIYLLARNYMDILDLLSKNKWPGEIEDLNAQLGELVIGCNLFGLSLDCSPHLNKKIGIELWFSEDSEHKRIILSELLLKLVKRGLLTKSQKKGLEKWEGEFIINNMPNAWSWPEEYQRMNVPFPESIKIRRWFYIKIIYDNQNKISAKCYLCFDRVVNKI